MKKYLVKANLARGAVDVSGGVPESIEYMPAGVHTISCLVNGKAKEITVSVSEQTAAQLQESLDAVLRAFAAGEMSRPFIDFDHEGKRAAAFPVSFFWQDGVRLNVEWTPEGREAVAGKSYNYFSPEWFLSPDGGVSVASPGAVGALCNVPAFQKIEKITSTQPTTKGNTMTEEEIQKMQSDLAAAQEANATLQAQLEELQKQKEAADNKLADVEQQKEEEAQKAEAARKALVEGKVEALVKAGRIAAKSKDAVVAAALAAPDKCDELLSAFPERAAASIPPVTAAAPAKEEEGKLSGVALAARGFQAMLKK